MPAYTSDPDRYRRPEGEGGADTVYHFPDQNPFRAARRAGGDRERKAVSHRDPAERRDRSAEKDTVQWIADRCGVSVKRGKYEALPDRIHFYISEKDIYHRGKTIYPIEKELGGTGLPYDDGVHIFFVNAAVDDGSRIAKLMKYFKTADPDDDSEGELSKRVRYLKREEGGVDIMCEVSERIMERGRKIGEEQGGKRKAYSTALNLSRMGLTPEQIASAVGESLEQVKSWLAGAKPAN